MESAQLDGESHLKLKDLSHDLLQTAREDASGQRVSLFKNFDVSFQFEEANGDIEEFEGRLILGRRRMHSEGDNIPAQKEVKLGINNILLRGLSAQGDVGVIAIVFRVGHDCKLFRHLEQEGKKGIKPPKDRHTVTVMSHVFLRVTIFVGLICVVCVIQTAALGGNWFNNLLYTFDGKETPAGVNAAQQFWDLTMVLIVLNAMIPFVLVGMSEVMQRARVWLLGKILLFFSFGQGTAGVGPSYKLLVWVALIRPDSCLGSNFGPQMNINSRARPKF